MKNIRKKVILMLALTFTCAALLTGCGTKKISIEESAKIYYDLVLKEESTELRELGCNEEDFLELSEGKKSEYAELLMQTFKSANLDITQDQIDVLSNSFMNAAGKVKGSVEVVSKDKQTAEVRISTTFIQFKSIAKEAANEAIDELKKLDELGADFNEAQLDNKFMELYVSKLTSIIDSNGVSSSTISDTFEFIKAGHEGSKGMIHIWTPKNPEKFSKRLSDMICGQ